MRLRRLVLAFPLLLAACGLAIVRGPESQVLAQAKEIHVGAGHTCTNDGAVLHCDEKDPRRNPLLVSVDGDLMAFATYADTHATFGHGCAELAPLIAASRKPQLFKIDCAVTTDGIDRLLMLAPFPIPEGGVADSSFEGAIDAFLRGANGYVANLKTAVR